MCVHRFPLNGTNLNPFALCPLFKHKICGPGFSSTVITQKLVFLFRMVLFFFPPVVCLRPGGNPTVFGPSLHFLPAHCMLRAIHSVTPFYPFYFALSPYLQEFHPVYLIFGFSRPGAGTPSPDAWTFYLLLYLLSARASASRPSPHLMKEIHIQDSSEAPPPFRRPNLNTFHD